jgi:hypothetical protein
LLFFLVCSVLECTETAGIGAGASRDCDRYDDHPCPGENPRMTLCELESDGAQASGTMSAVIALAGRPLSLLLTMVDGSADGDDGDDGRGVSSVLCDAAIAASVAGNGANGSSSLVSLIVYTIFSRSSDVMCFSCPRLRLSEDSDVGFEASWLIFSGSLRASP